MVDDPVEELHVLPHCLQAFLEKGGVVARKRKSGDPGIGYVALHDFRGANVECSDSLRRFLRLSDVGLVPHRPVANASSEVPRNRIHPGVPRRKPLR